MHQYLTAQVRQGLRRRRQRRSGSVGGGAQGHGATMVWPLARGRPRSQGRAGQGRRRSAQHLPADRTRASATQFEHRAWACSAATGRHLPPLNTRRLIGIIRTFLQCANRLQDRLGSRLSIRRCRRCWRRSASSRGSVSTATLIRRSPWHHCTVTPILGSSELKERWRRALPDWATRMPWPAARPTSWFWVSCPSWSAD